MHLTFWKCEAAGQTHKGGRERNEDNFCILGDGEVVAVADGLGGHPGGDIASELAIQAIGDEFVASWKSTTANDVREWMRRALLRAQRSILYPPSPPYGSWRMSAMGTTIVLAGRTGNELQIAWLGDSRCYRLNSGQLVKVTYDHGFDNAVNRCLGGGSGQYHAADFRKVTIRKHGVVVLCSDGLNNSVPEHEIESTLSANLPPGKSAEQMCGDLIQAALDHHTDDNVTAVVLKYVQP